MGSIRTRNNSFWPFSTTMIRIIGALVLLTTTASAEPSLCRAGATPLFSCPVGHKLVSICNADGKLTYYFGTPGKIEMSSQALFRAERGFSGGGETQISFRNDSYTYTIYDKTTRTSFSADAHNDPQFTSGLFIQKDGKTISTTECGSDATIPATVSSAIPPGPFIEH